MEIYLPELIAFFSILITAICGYIFFSLVKEEHKGTVMTTSTPTHREALKTIFLTHLKLANKEECTDSATYLFYYEGKWYVPISQEENILYNIFEDLILYYKKD